MPGSGTDSTIKDIDTPEYLVEGLENDWKARVQQRRGCCNPLLTR